MLRTATTVVVPVSVMKLWLPVTLGSGCGTSCHRIAEGFVAPSVICVRRIEQELCMWLVGVAAAKHVLKFKDS